jgi:hypothetical protein
MNFFLVEYFNSEDKCIAYAVLVAKDLQEAQDICEAHPTADHCYILELTADYASEPGVVVYEPLLCEECLIRMNETIGNEILN